MRNLHSSRYFSADTSSPGPVVEDANDDRGTPSFLFLGVVMTGVLLLIFVLLPRPQLRGPIGEYTPEADPAVDSYGVVDKAAGTYRVPVAVVAAKVVENPGMLAPIEPAGGVVEIDTSTPEGQGQARISEQVQQRYGVTDEQVMQAVEHFGAKTDETFKPILQRIATTLNASLS